MSETNSQINETTELLKAQGLVEADKKLSAEDEAANSFGTLLPTFKRRYRNLTGGAKDRITEALIEFPLNAKPLKFQSKNEEMVFNLAKHLIDCNMIIVNAAMAERNKRIDAETAAKTENNEGTSSVNTETTSS